MLKFSKVIALAVAAMAVSQGANALPQIHSDLQNYFTDQNPTPRPVILVFKNKMPLPEGRFSSGDRAKIQALMVRNAQVSQSSVLQQVVEYRKQGIDCDTKFFWINNTLGIFTQKETLKKIINNDDIIAVYPNRIFKINLPFVNSINQVSDTDFTYGLKKLRIPEMREKKSDLDGRGVKVGILDTGIDAEHPDLKGRTLIFKDFIDNKPAPYDDHGHGTHVAGTIGGTGVSKVAIGVAPASQFIVGKLFGKNGSTTEAKILEAMQWIADPDKNPATNDAPALVSNSWGGGTSSPNLDPADDPECRALDAWVKLAIAPIFAAGNSGPRPGTVGMPAACPNAISVGATDANDAIANFSSRGPAVWKTGTLIKPMISAPGVKVYSSMPGGRYAEMSGTSMATPHVSGLAALIYQVNPKMDVATLAKMLTEGSVDLGEKGNDNVFGWGRIDAINTLKVLYSSLLK